MQLHEVLYLISFSATVKRLTLNDLEMPFLCATAF